MPEGLAEIDAFLARAPAFSRFSDVVDEALYRPLPAGWILGLADVTDSTGAIGEGRYKAVNMAGAGVIAAVGNAIGVHRFPFAFGGDGAAFAVPGVLAPKVGAALAAMARFSAAELELTLRTAWLPIEIVRAHGLDVTVARFEVSEALSYAMFSGGGLSWAEARLKAGDLPAPQDAGVEGPDLTGLSCRFEPVRSSRGRIVSLIVLPLPEAPAGGFADLVRDLIRIVRDDAGAEGNPITPGTLRLRWPPAGLRLEERAGRGRRNRYLHGAWLAGFTFFSYLIFATGLRLGGFDPARYRRELQGNSDFRKFADRLELTVDCSLETIDRMQRRLDAAEREKVAVAGLHPQQDALITCLVRSPAAPDHIHFIDGADGGYAQAARLVKDKIAARERTAT